MTSGPSVCNDRRFVAGCKSNARSRRVAEEAVRDALQGGGTTRAVGGSEVQIGKPSAEKSRHHRADRMRVQQHRETVQRPYTLNLRCELGVIGIEIRGAPSGDLVDV